MSSDDSNNDSFDRALATMEMPSEQKKPKLTLVSYSPATSTEAASSISTENASSIPTGAVSSTSIEAASSTSAEAASSTSTKVASSTSTEAASSTSSSHNNKLPPMKNLPTSQYHISVHPKQRGNPVLKSITNVPWEFDDIVPDYIVGPTACVLFLSLKYHSLNPDYIHNRLKVLGKRFEIRVLLVQVDTKEPHNALKHLTRMCFLADLTLMLAWNPEEAGKMIETYKFLQNEPPDLIMERAEQYPHQKLVGALTNIKPLNKTDAMTLLQNFGSLANLINSTEDQLSQCDGLGPRKAKKMFQTFNEPFLNK